MRYVGPRPAKSWNINLCSVCKMIATNIVPEPSAAL